MPLTSEAGGDPLFSATLCITVRSFQNLEIPMILINSQKDVDFWVNFVNLMKSIINFLPRKIHKWTYTHIVHA